MARFATTVSTRRMRFLFVAFLSVLLILLLILNSHHKRQLEVLKTLSCFMQSDVEYTASDLPTPLDDVLHTAAQPTPGRSIFFLETSCSSKSDPRRNMLQLTARQACAIESAALHNPNLQVFLLFGSPRYQQQLEGNDSLIDAILSYPNVQLRQLNLRRYAADTPIEDWFDWQGKLFQSSYLMIHISDLLRLITLYRFGGIYMDLDVVVLRSLENVPLNYAGAESDTHVANGVMSLAPTGFGHEFAESCLREFSQHFNGNSWGHNGPGVITRVAQRICDTKNITLMQQDQQRCQGFRVFDRMAFYAVRWADWRHFFEEKFTTQTLEQTKDSYLIHVWNKHSQQQRIKVGSNVAYGKIAEQHCPRTYAAAGEYF